MHGRKNHFKIRLGLLHVLFDEFEDDYLIKFSLDKRWTKSFSAKQDNKRPNALLYLYSENNGRD